MNVKQWLVNINSLCQFPSVEVPGKKASNSELQRWIEQGSILFNGERVTPKEDMDFPLISVIMFPKSNVRRCTLL